MDIDPLRHMFLDAFFLITQQQQLTARTEGAGAARISFKDREGG